MAYQNVIFEQETGGITRITIKRPEVHNAPNLETRRELRDVLDRVAADAGVRVVVVTGAGEKSFVSGADVSQFQGRDPGEIAEYVRTLGQQLYNDFEDCAVPVIAAVNGYCFGGGLELAMSCDIRLAAANATFCLPEIKVGLIPGGGGTQRLPRLIGPGRAKRMMYTGEVIDAALAESWGLVDGVVAPADLAAEVNRLAGAIVGKSPLLIRQFKRLTNQGLHGDLATGLLRERDGFAAIFSSHDTREGINAFLEKRRPEFTGE